MKNVKSMNQVKKLMFDLDTDQLSELAAHFKDCRAMLNMKAKTTFTVGQKVKFGKLLGVITKLNRTKALCFVEKDNANWTVPFSRMEAV